MTPTTPQVKPVRKNPASVKVFGAFVVSWTASVAANATDLSYHGWNGQVDIINGSFAGCHLDSPSPTGEMPGSLIRVFSDSTTGFNIEFSDSLVGAATPPSGGEVYEVSLSTLDDYPWRAHREHVVSPFEARILAVQVNGLDAAVRVVVPIPVDSPLLQHLKGAVALEVKWSGFGEPGHYVEAGHYVNLRHVAATDPSSWILVDPEAWTETGQT